MTTLLLFTIAVILAVGLVAVLSVLCEIRDAVGESCTAMQRVADELADEFEEDEWAVVRGKKFTPNGTEGPFGGKSP